MITETPGVNYCLLFLRHLLNRSRVGGFEGEFDIFIRGFDQSHTNVSMASATCCLCVRLGTCACAHTNTHKHTHTHTHTQTYSSCLHAHIFPRGFCPVKWISKASIYSYLSLPGPRKQSVGVRGQRSGLGQRQDRGDSHFKGKHDPF